MNNFHKQQTHLLLVVGVGFIEVVFFVVVAAVGGNSSFLLSDSSANTNNTLTPNSSLSSSPRQSFASGSRTNSSPAVTPASINSSALQEEVTSALSDWKSAAEAHDLNSYMNCYADTIDYYKAKGWSRSRVRVDKQRAFSAFDYLQISLKNISVSLDPSGERAIAVMDKTWNFTGAGKTSSGSVQQQMVLIKSGGRWLIAGEKDMKVYNTRNF